MPVQKFSAMDPSGSWNMDARDQTAMWNADRGDRINMWQTNRADQGGRDAWQREVALAKLGLDREMYQGTREDNRTGADRHYGYLEKQLGAEQERYKSRDAREQAAHELDMRTRNLEITGREEDDFAMDTVDYKALGWDDKTAAAVNAMPRSVRKQFLANAAGRNFEALNRPQDQQYRREDQRNAAAEDAAARLEGGQYTGEREAQRLRSVANRGGMKDVNVGRGQMQAASAVMAQPEFGQAVETLRSQLRGIPDVYKMGTQEGAAVGAILTQAIESQASELAKQFGTDPRQLAQLLYAEVSKGAPGQERGFWSGLGRGISETATLGFAETQNEAAQRLLAERFAQ